MAIVGHIIWRTNIDLAEMIDVNFKRIIIHILCQLQLKIQRTVYGLVTI